MRNPLKSHQVEIVMFDISDTAKAMERMAEVLQTPLLTEQSDIEAIHQAMKCMASRVSLLADLVAEAHSDAESKPLCAVASAVLPTLEIGAPMEGGDHD